MKAHVIPRCRGHVLDTSQAMSLYSCWSTTEQRSILPRKRSTAQLLSFKCMCGICSGWRIVACGHRHVPMDFVKEKWHICSLPLVSINSCTKNKVRKQRRRSNVVIRIVRVIFISSFLFVCLLLNHSFPTNPNMYILTALNFFFYYNFTTTFAPASLFWFLISGMDFRNWCRRI